MLIKKESNVKKKLENKYVFGRKIYLHEKHSDQDDSPLFDIEWTAHPFNKPQALIIQKGRIMKAIMLKRRENVHKNPSLYI